MPKDKMARKKFADPLDRFSEKRGRGRPYKIRASEVSGRAYNYHLIFSQIWNVAGEQLLRATTEEEIIKALEQTSQKGEFVHIVPLILTVLRDPEFPKRDKKARIKFLADSLAARGAVTPRTSRDICARERARERKKSVHRILRREYYVECSCGYKGPARDNACRKCGAEISPTLQELMGQALF
jgi:hypothetical protein